jgi:hypothetical protein
MSSEDLKHLIKTAVDVTVSAVTIPASFLSSPEEIKRREDICGSCEFHIKENDKCGECSCPLKRVRKYTQAHCKILKW